MAGTGLWHCLHGWGRAAEKTHWPCLTPQCGFEPISGTVGGHKSFNRNWGITGSRGPWEAEPGCKGSAVLTENQEFRSPKKCEAFPFNFLVFAISKIKDLSPGLKYFDQSPWFSSSLKVLVFALKFYFLLKVHKNFAEIFIRRDTAEKLSFVSVKCAAENLSLITWDSVPDLHFEYLERVEWELAVTWLQQDCGSNMRQFCALPGFLCP